MTALLFGGEWPQKSLDLALMYATTNSWTEIMEQLHEDGRANPDYLLSNGIAEAALLGRYKAFSLAAEKGFEWRNLRHAHVWLAHMNRYRELCFLADNDETVLCPAVLNAAIRARSNEVVDLLLSYKWKIDDTEVLELLMDLPKMQRIVPAILEKGAPTSVRVFINRKERFSPTNATLIRNAHIKWRWRQIKAIRRIWGFWREFILDYYCPGNQTYPQGNGFKLAHQDFIENTRKRK